MIIKPAQETPLHALRSVAKILGVLVR